MLNVYHYVRNVNCLRLTIIACSTIQLSRPDFETKKLF